MSTIKKVCVLLSTYNGEKYLGEQIESILKQEGVKVKLLIRDDGSTDTTPRILKKYKEKKFLDYYCGENIGYAKSFMKLANENIDEADYYAFCDQDDVWDSKKLISAINKLEQVKNVKYKLYFSNLTLVDEKLEKIGIKEYEKLKINFKTAMIRFNIAGCTMVFNNELLKMTSKKQFFDLNMSHDSWIYKICLAIGGKVIFDQNSYIKYRQHGQNVTGVKQGLIKRIKRELTIFNGKKNYRLKQAKCIYEIYQEFLPKENSKLIRDIIQYDKSLKNTLALAFKKDFKFGIKRIDLLTFLQIITRRY